MPNLPKTLLLLHWSKVQPTSTLSVQQYPLQKKKKSIDSNLLNQEKCSETQLPYCGDLRLTTKIK